MVFIKVEKLSELGLLEGWDDWDRTFKYQIKLE